jgi:isopenicillin-N epimerase
MDSRQTGGSDSPAAEWALDPNVTYLNHGSFGACLRAILAVQGRWRDKLEAQPIHFLTRDLEDLLDWSRSEIGAFVGADAEDLALMPNATSGISTVLRSLAFERGDEILITNHAYTAAANAARFVAALSGARVSLASIPFPLESPEQAFDAVMAAVTPKTKLAIVEHVTSATALVLPIEKLTSAFAEKGIDVLVDGAHGPGMRRLGLRDLRPAYYVGTLHKWVCAPKGSAFLYVRRDRQARIKPLAIGNGMSDARTDRSRFRLDFGWTGTIDPSAWLTAPAAIDGMAEMVPGGWPTLMEANHTMASMARLMLAESLVTAVPSPDEMTGSMATLILPGGPWTRNEVQRQIAAMEAVLRARRLEVPVLPWPSPLLADWGYLPEDTRFEITVRISAHLYNHMGQYERLASTLAGLVDAGRTVGR